MAISDNKIPAGEISSRHVQSAPDALSDTPARNKAVFDNLTEYFIGKYNDLIDDIDSDFLSTNEMGAGLTVDGDVSWRYALSKGESFGFNFSGNITQITTGFRTIVGDVDGLTMDDFMDAYLTINSTDYECGDSWANGNNVYTTCKINGVTIDIIYDTTNGNITLEHSTNPLDTTYWNVSMYRGAAEKVPAKCLPADLTSAGYAELDARTDSLETLTSDLDDRADKWNGVVLDKTAHTVTQSTDRIKTFTNGSEMELWLDDIPFGDIAVSVANSGGTYTATVTDTTATEILTGLTATGMADGLGNIGGVRFDATANIGSCNCVISSAVLKSQANYITGIKAIGTDEAYIADMTTLAKQIKSYDITENVYTDTINFTATNKSFQVHGNILKATFYGTTAASISTGSTKRIFKLPTNVKPKDRQYVSITSTRTIYADNSGDIYIENIGSSSISSGTFVAVNAIIFIG